MEEQKICTKCELTKELSDYHPRLKGKFGRHSICKECVSVAYSIWRKNAVSRALPQALEKRCRKCGKVKPGSEFGVNRAVKDGLQSWCTQCKSRNVLTSKRKFMGEIYALKERTPCADCGKSYKYWVMQFDHLPGKKKVCMVSAFLSGGTRLLRKGPVGGREGLLNELEKCEIVCANCHATRTHLRRPDPL